MRGTRPAASRAHWALFTGFALLFVGTVLIAIEHYAAKMMGRSPMDPVFHKGWYFAIFEVTLEFAGILLVGGTCWFMARRLRGRSSMAQHFSDWIVLSSVLFLGLSGYVLEGARIIREQTPLPGISFVGYAMARLLERCGLGQVSVHGFHQTIWWLHGVAALALVAGMPYCRLLHVVAGSVSIATAQTELGVMQPVSLEEVEKTGSVGAGHIRDFSQSQLVRLDACVSCGRCEDACPAFVAGKPLSPRDLVQDLRAQLDGATATSPGDTLPGVVIAQNTLWSCTTCSACVDVCPLDVAPLEFITDMRRFVIGEGLFRGTAATALQKMQRSGNPWGLASADRLSWAKGLSVPTVDDNPDFEILYWVGCAAAYDRRIQKVARAVVHLLDAAQVNYA
ncbi:MAG: 4Fe-4S dicluster domain-containing protein, partial [Pseudomonadales bacterium]